MSKRNSASDSDLAKTNYWDETWAQVALPRKMNPERNPIDRKAQSFLRKMLPTEAKFLEIGCGASSWMPFFGGEMGYELWGADYSKPGIELTKKNLDLFGLKANLLLGDFTQMDIEKDSFDVVYSGGVIEHYKDPTPIFKKSFEILRPGGLKLTFIPNNWGLFGWLQKKFDPKVYDVHVPYGAADLDRFQLQVGFEKVVAGRPFGVFYSGILNWQNRSKPFPAFVNKLLAYSLQTLDRVVGWMGLAFGDVFESHLLSPYFVSIYRKPLNK